MVVFLLIANCVNLNNSTTEIINAAIMVGKKYDKVLDWYPDISDPIGCITLCLKVNILSQFCLFLLRSSALNN